MSLTPAHRGTIFLEDARVLEHREFPGSQFVMRLAAPRCAAAATPGSFVHLTCGPDLPMRRPLSIMRTSAREGWFEVLYKVVGHGLAELALRKTGETLSCLGPIGRGFTANPARPRLLLIGGGVGIPPMVFLAETLAAGKGAWKPLVLMGSELPYPFELATSRLAANGLPDGVTAAMPLLESLGVPSRLASLSGFPGCHRGFVTELADAWLTSLGAKERAEVELFACGPHGMLIAVAALARRRGVPCQVSLEENMACGVGGCAGCTVLVKTPDGPAMKRVCVDGPVFDAATVFSA
ncbi:MAG TPA: dihydroorotate dehydrogenase electron transfer subunit [Steroidobacteraceae bacterium]|jgi:dihydroorotate dehydrogenase electron transfer subunit|nr:dihydroorotate dehydrogenase electron transfer subunit [Steroidobacteraceae bacterium]